MIDRGALLDDLQKLVKKLELDLRARYDEVPEVGRTVDAEYRRARDAGRTELGFEEWRADAITQQAVAWVLSCVFVRFLEDNRLLDPPKLAGPGDRLGRARDEHELYFRSHPTETDREYLLAVFNDLAKKPGTKDLFGPHNPLRQLPTWLSGDAAGDLLKFFQAIDADTGQLVHDFTDDDWDTRFLGDLYQDLSEAARKKYALLQTPVFVEEFILDRTLEPAIETFGLADFRLIDPACGSGHFLLGSVQRVYDHWARREPGTSRRELVQRALDSVHGVDLNPYAVAIARFRLLLVALRVCEITKLAHAPDFRLHLVCGDSLLHGTPNDQQNWLSAYEHTYHAEDRDELRRLLQPGCYHAVVANPPYITPKDRGLNQEYRHRYPRVCYRQYSLAVPFMQRIFDLACDGGFTGQITANSFMKREFGKKLIEEFFPRVDLTHVVDTSGAYIPGHGTPTVILFGRNRKPMASVIRTVMGIRGEPTTPDDPSQGKVWLAIFNQIDQPGSQNEFVSVADSLRESFHEHPWNIGGGGASELKERLDDQAASVLGDNVEPPIGRAVRIAEEEAFVFPEPRLRQSRCSITQFRGFLLGENVRDWKSEFDTSVWYPYCEDSKDSDMLRQLWPWRATLLNRATFQGNMGDAGLPWYAYMQHTASAYRTPLSIAFAFVATHNHFVLDLGGKVFNRSAPVIKLPTDSTKDSHLNLLGLLNSSTACFWMKHVFSTKGSSGIGRGVYDEAWEKHYEFAAIGLSQFPIPVKQPTSLAKYLDFKAQQLQHYEPAAALRRREMTRDRLEALEVLHDGALWQMIAAQEELDWQCYHLYGLTDELLTLGEEPPLLVLGERTFEIVMARKMKAGELQTTWFERHGSKPITEIPAKWPAKYRELVEQRIAAIESNPNIALIEQPEYKRRWNVTPWEEKVAAALKSWLLDRLESYFDLDGRMNERSEPTAKVDVSLISTAKLSDLAAADAEFMTVAELYRDRADFDVTRLVAELVEAESVPLLPVLRYKPSGLDKRRAWERTWELQRQEDAIDARTKLPKEDPQYLSEWDARALKEKEVGKIDPPPKYASADFQSTTYWRLRGKLDVPKERWISFLHCPAADGTALVAWAGYNHLQLAKAISAYYVDVQENQGGRNDPRLVPLLACLIELLPWLKQWRNAVDPEYGLPMGDYFEGFVQDEARQMGKTLEEVRAWQPPRATRRGRR